MVLKRCMGDFYKSAILILILHNQTMGSLYNRPVTLMNLGVAGDNTQQRRVLGKSGTFSMAKSLILKDKHYVITFIDTFNTRASTATCFIKY